MSMKLRLACVGGTTTSSTTDPNFSSVSLLLTGDDLLDHSASPKTVTVNGNTAVSTSIKKYGVGSLYFDGGSYISVPASTNWVTDTTSSLTIECWLYPTIQQYSYITDQPTGNAAAIAIQFGSAVQNGDYIYVYNGVFVAQISNITIPLNQWTHFAFVLNSGVPKVYVNGVLQTGTYISNTGWGLNQPIHIGHYAGGVAGTNQYGFKGYIDDFRITKGVARYTANFTPPTQALPTS